MGDKHTGNGHHHNSAANSNTSGGVGAGERLTLLGYSDQEHGLVLPSYEEALRSVTGEMMRWLDTVHLQGGGQRGPQQAGGGAGALQAPCGGTQVRSS